MARSAASAARVGGATASQHWGQSATPFLTASEVPSPSAAVPAPLTQPPSEASGVQVATGTNATAVHARAGAARSSTPALSAGVPVAPQHAAAVTSVTGDAGPY